MQREHSAHSCRVASVSTEILTAEEQNALELVYAIAPCPEQAALLPIAHDEFSLSADLLADAEFLESKE